MISEFIITHLKKKFKEKPILLIYDNREQYKAIALSLADKNTKVFDASESIIEARENAVLYLAKELPVETNKKMVVYIPYETPLDKQERIRDPFSIFSFCGSVFPSNPEDRYIELCKSCFPGKEQQIDELFSNETPNFNTIDALADDAKWAKLETVTGGKSPKEIILTILFPSESQQYGLANDKSWQKEWHDFSNSVLDLKTKSKNLEEIQNELWQHLLYSEFVFDLPVQLPPKLKSVPVANVAVKGLIFDLCKAIRSTKYIEDIYVDKANKIAETLELPNLFKDSKELGDIVTFAFEDNTYFSNYVEKIQAGDYKSAKQLIDSNSSNIWVSCDKERAIYWNIARHALNLLIQTSNLTGYSKCKKTGELIDFYASKAFEIDQNQRQFERSILDVFNINSFLNSLIATVRSKYKQYVEDKLKVFQALVKENGWPVEGYLSNIQVFEKIVAPEMQGRRKIAYLLVDALRFELAKEIEKQIEKHFQVEITPCCAYLPTITKFGMASLMPDANTTLRLEILNEKLEAFMDDKPLTTLSQRSDYYRDKFGDLCQIMNLDEFLNKEPDSKTQLLVITTNEIDNAGENLESNALTDIQRAVQKLTKSIYRIKEAGFQKAIIVTDHGFVLNPVFEPGDNTSKPKGEWSLVKSRCLAGKGEADNGTLMFNPEQIGIRSEIKNFIFTKNYAVFEKNVKYFHEGLSLQENILPVMQISFKQEKKEKGFEAHITYKGKDSGVITTLRPAIEFSSFSKGELNFELASVKIEAISDGNIVGLPIPGNKVNSSNNLIEFTPGESFKITLAMEEYFEGSFEVIALDPVTNKTYSTISLKTAYL